MKRFISFRLTVVCCALLALSLLFVAPAAHSAPLTSTLMAPFRALATVLGFPSPKTEIPAPKKVVRLAQNVDSAPSRVVARALTFTVNDTTDAADVSTTDNACDTNLTTIGSQCSLRAAIQQANATAGADTINFAIPGAGVHTIVPTSALPNITEAVTINGYSQSGSSANTLATGNDAVLLIEISGAGTAANGLTLQGTGSTLRGLIINGSFLSGVIVSGSGGHTIAGCFIGTNSNGTSAVPNRSSGVVVDSANNAIGGNTPAARNVISGNTSDGIVLSGGGAVTNQVQGNYIGTNATGTAPLPNTTNGVNIGFGSQNNTIGGTTAAARNIISGNTSNGISVANTCDITTIQGNYVGLNAAGTTAIANGASGVAINSVSDTISGNVISGNTGTGLDIVGDGTPATATINAFNNIIGLNAAKTAKRPNDIGVEINSRDNVTLGALGQGNTISGNTNEGVSIINFIAGTDGITVQGNSIGGAGLGNGGDGIFIGGVGEQILSNTIVGNGGNGLTLQGATNVAIQQNNIGFDTNGNTGSGVFLSNGAKNTLIGGAVGDTFSTAEFKGNLIAGNSVGVTVNSGADDATGNSIRGNTIENNTGLGIDLNGDGTVAASNDFQDPDTGDNLLQNPPIIDNIVNGDTVNYHFNSTPNTQFVIDFYDNNVASTADAEGSFGLGSMTVTTDSNGDVQTAFAATSVSGFVTAVAIDPNGNTSEFSTAVRGPRNLVVDTTLDTNLTACTATAGDCTLRGAINAANASSGADTISFNIPAAQAVGGIFTIAPTSALPTISYPVTIDGYTQSGATPNTNATGALNTILKVEINGAGAGATTSGFNFTGAGDNCTIRGLVINRFGGSGISADNSTVSETFAGNFIGTNATGTAKLANGTGITLSTPHSNTTIGGTTAAARNLISSNTTTGIALGGTSNFVQGNLIGTNATCTAALGNGDGVLISGQTNIIGGTTAAARNIISGNTQNGVHSNNFGNANTISGNFIGTNATGTGPIANTLAGVLLDLSNGDIIGGSTTTARNIISGNGRDGVELAGNVVGNAKNANINGNYIGTNATGTGAIRNGRDGIHMDRVALINIGDDLGNVISGNTQNGIFLANSNNNIQIRGNFIGVDNTGNAPLPNFTGIFLQTASGVTIGAAGTTERNIISGNTNTGLFVGDSAPNAIQNNYIGLGANGTTDVGNGGNGVFLSGSTNSMTVGSTTAGLGNVISGNAGGVRLENTGNNVLVQGNIIGLAADGTTVKGNDAYGVGIFNSANNVIGGSPSQPNGRNTISGNGGAGVEINGATSTGNNVTLNYIGTDVGGTLDKGNVSDGVRIFNASNNTIGTNSGLGGGALIAGNGGDGIQISATTGNSASANTILDNKIGFSITGSANALPNDGAGISIEDGAAGNIIGVSSFPNTIAHNGNAGVLVTTAAGTGNQITRNSIFQNGGLGIDLGATGVTANDTGDADTGGNALQNYPILTSVTLSSGNTAVAGTFNSVPNTNFTLEFFSDPTPDASGNGEGQTFLGQLGVTTDASGDAPPFTFNLAGNITDPISATATPANAPFNTSEFSNAVRAPRNFVVDTTSDANLTACTTAANDCSLRGAINGANAKPGVDNITFAISGTGVQTINLTANLPTLTQPVTIDGYTQTGARQNTQADYDDAVILIELNGAGINGGSTALTINGGSSTIRGLAINRFTNGGISINNVGNNIIEGCFIGTNTTGTNNFAGSSNNGTGLGITNSPNNRIGGTTPAQRNIISGNRLGGINISVGLGGGLNGDNNIVQGNFIGITAKGFTGNTAFAAAIPVALGNGGGGVRVDTASGTQIGGTTAAERNIISSNNGQINLFTSGTLVRGNYIGTDTKGTTGLGGTNGGIFMQGGSNTIGGLTATPGVAPGNVISGNGTSGIETNGNAVPGHTIQGNIIGLDVTGTTAIPNGDRGIWLRNAGGSNIIGGTTTTARNIISGNADSGIDIGNPNNVVRGNYVGTNRSGTAAFGNGLYGVTLFAGPNTIGGTTAATRNIISGNSASGLRVFNSNGNAIKGNYIGVAADGTTPLGNNGTNADGITLDAGSASNVIGGTGTGEANIIANNQARGILLTSGAGTNNRISGNSIYNNGNLGIDLNTDGVSNNDTDDTDAGANNTQNFPVLSNVRLNSGNTLVDVSLNSASGIYNLDFYSNTTADPSGNGEGQTYVGSDSLTIPTGTTTATKTVALTGDLTALLLTATATSSSGNTSEFSAVVKSSPNIAINDAAVNETDSGTINLTFTVSLSAATTQTVTVAYATANGSATTPADYTATNGTLTFAPSQTTKTINVPIVGDTLDENNETLFVNLSGATNGTITDAQGRGTITDNDNPPTISINDATVNEGNSGTTNAVFRVSLSTVSSKAVSVSFATANGTATAPADYAALPSTTLTIPAGSTSATVTVAVNGDTVVESNETFFVNLSTPVNATIADAQGVGTIINDDSSGVSCAATGIEAWYRAEGNARDSASNHDGTLLNGVTFTSSFSGRAFKFDGVDDYVQVPDSPSLDPTAQASLAAWVYFNQTPTEAGHPMAIITKSGFGKDLDLQAFGDQFFFHIAQGGNTINVASTTRIQKNRWYHVVGTYVANDRIQIYVNGALENTLLISGITRQTNGNPLTIGENFTFRGRLFNGLIDEAQLYTRALTATDVRSVYSSGISGSCLVPLSINTPLNLVVDTTSDADLSACTANPNDCSLRGAINRANANLAADSISFNIPGTGFQTITPATALPALTAAGTTIDGVAPTGSGATGPIIIINSPTAATGTGLNVRSANNTLRNLVFSNWQIGISMAGSNVTGNRVQNCRIGTDGAGLAAAPNTVGLQLSAGAKNNIIGGSNGEGNLISGNSLIGLQLVNSSTNRIEGNIIGLNSAGAALSNGAFGDGMQLLNASNGNIIGGLTSGARNLISGNNGVGILIGGSSANQVRGNFIGTNASGKTAIANGRGLRIETGASGNIIGGTTAPYRNIISGSEYGVLFFGSTTTGNAVVGNYIGTDVNGTSALSNRFGVGIFGAVRNTIGGTASGSRNIISGNSDANVYIAENAANNSVLGNYIGTTLTGDASLGAFSTTAGVWIDSGSNGNIIGGTTDAARNVISGNGGNGILISGRSFGSGSLARLNRVTGNYIGLSATGDAIVTNAGEGIILSEGALSNVIGVSGGGRNIISGNAGSGVTIVDKGTNSNTVQNNWVGLDKNGNALGNEKYGVSIFNGAQNNLIGGTVAGTGNVLSGNQFHGLGISGTGTNSNLAQGNFIGTDSTGTAARANTNGGVTIFGGAQNNTIGGSIAGAGNIVSGNGNGALGSGIGIVDSGTSGNRVQGNYVGVNRNGDAALPNLGDGIEIVNGASNNLIGASGAGRNIVSGNARYGISMSGTGTNSNSVFNNWVGLNAAGNGVLGNVAQGIVMHDGAQRNRIGSATAGTGNVVAGNTHNGIGIGGVSGPTSGQNTAFNIVQGNIIGTDPSGTRTGFGNLLPGVAIAQGAHDNLIGGTAIGEGNLISGNLSDGIFIGNPTATANRIQGNKIGLKADGISALPNANNGIFIQGSGNIVGGSTTALGKGAGNIIAGNGNNLTAQGAGIRISGAAASANVVAGNLVGTNAGATAAIPNFHGIEIESGATDNIIGGSDASLRNIISGNTQRGIYITGNGTSNNKVQGNYIGTNLNGSSAIANQFDGVTVTFGASNNLIGGFTATPGTGAGNIVSGNLIGGVTLEDDARSNSVYGNAIGVAANGTSALPNQAGTQAGWGILIVASSSNTIGNITTGANFIANNAGPGIGLDDEPARGALNGNRLRGNRIFNNGGLGIDLYSLSNLQGPTPNDNTANDSDGGANRLQNYPELATATQSGSGQALVLQGSLTSTPNRSFSVDVYTNTAADPSGFGEGQTYLGSFDISNGTFTQSLPVNGNLADQFITLTATDKTTGDTSEFSQAKQVTLPSTITVSLSPPNVTLNSGGTQQFTATVSGSTNQAVTYSVDGGTANGSITASGLYTAPAVAGTYTVRATSAANPAVSGTATVNVQAPAGNPLLAWGYNQYGSVGDGSNANRSAPVPVNIIQNAQLIAAGGSHSLAVAGNVLYAWGDNDSGQLGDGTRTSRNQPVAISLPAGIRADSIVALSCGWYHSLALISDGRVLAWGYNKDGQCGGTADAPRYVPTPRFVNGLPKISAISGGTLHSLALDSSGRVWAWGNNFYGQLGNGSIENVNSTPALVPNLSGVKSIGAGGGHSLALLNDGTARAWGWNFYGQLGDGLSGYQNNGDERRSAVPVVVKNVSNGAQLSAGYAHNLVLKSDGSLLSWGNNFYGQLGRSTSDANGPLAASVRDASGGIFGNVRSDVRSISAGSGHNLIIRNDGTIWSWGYNEFGNLGLGNFSTDESEPQQVPNLSSAEIVAAGYAHSVAKATQGSGSGGTGGVSGSHFQNHSDAEISETLSSTTPFASNSSVVLTFTTDIKSAGTTSLTVNGQNARVQKVEVHGNAVTILLSPDSLQAGDKVQVTWQDFVAKNGQTLRGSTDSVIAE